MLKSLSLILLLKLTSNFTAMPLGTDNLIDELESESLWASVHQRANFAKKQKNNKTLYFVIGAAAGIAAVALCGGSLYWYAQQAEKSRLQDKENNNNIISDDNVKNNDDNNNNLQPDLPGLQNDITPKPIEREQPEELPQPQPPKIEVHQNNLPEFNDLGEFRVFAQKTIELLNSKIIEKSNKIVSEFNYLSQCQQLTPNQQQQRITIIQGLFDEFDSLNKERFGFIADQATFCEKNNQKFVDIVNVKNINGSDKIREAQKYVTAVKNDIKSHYQEPQKNGRYKK